MCYCLWRCMWLTQGPNILQDMCQGNFYYLISVYLKQESSPPHGQQRLFSDNALDHLCLVFDCCTCWSNKRHHKQTEPVNEHKIICHCDLTLNTGYDIYLPMWNLTWIPPTCFEIKSILHFHFSHLKSCIYLIKNTVKQ